METNHMYIIFSDTKAVFWMPKRLFPKEVHNELGNFIADRLLQKPIVPVSDVESAPAKGKKKSKSKKKKAEA
jgi:hypothetical protein